MRCWSRSSSRTCTTWTTRWRKSTATSSRSPAPRRMSARSGWCASTRSDARRRARCCWTSPARWSARWRGHHRQATRGRGEKRRSGPPSRGGRAGARVKTRARGRRAPADSEDAEARREAGLSESPTGVDSEPEEELARCNRRRGCSAGRGRRGWPTIQASASWPQRRAAPFGCQGAGDPGVAAGSPDKRRGTRRSKEKSRLRQTCTRS